MLERERKKERRVQVVRGRSLCGVMPEYKKLLLRLHCMGPPKVPPPKTKRLFPLQKRAGQARLYYCQPSVSSTAAASNLLLMSGCIHIVTPVPGCTPLARTAARAGCAHFKNSCPLQNIVQKGQEPSCQRGFAAALL